MKFFFFFSIFSLSAFSDPTCGEKHLTPYKLSPIGRVFKSVNISKKLTDNQVLTWSVKYSGFNQEQISLQSIIQDGVVKISVPFHINQESYFLELAYKTNFNVASENFAYIRNYRVLDKFGKTKILSNTLFGKELNYVFTKVEASLHELTEAREVTIETVTGGHIRFPAMLNQEILEEYKSFMKRFLYTADFQPVRGTFNTLSAMLGGPRKSGLPDQSELVKIQSYRDYLIKSLVLNKRNIIKSFADRTASILLSIGVATGLGVVYIDYIRGILFEEQKGQRQEDLPSIYDLKNDMMKLLKKEIESKDSLNVIAKQTNVLEQEAKQILINVPIKIKTISGDSLNYLIIPDSTSRSGLTIIQKDSIQ